jgi:hypothetical protein
VNARDAIARRTVGNIFVNCTTCEIEIPQEVLRRRRKWKGCFRKEKDVAGLELGPIILALRRRPRIDGHKFHVSIQLTVAGRADDGRRLCLLYRVEKQARQLTAEDRLRLRQIHARPILDKLREYLLEIQAEVLPKSPEGRAVRYALKNWTALNRYSEDGDLEIDNTGTERSIRGVAKGSSLCTSLSSA